MHGHRLLILFLTWAYLVIIGGYNVSDISAFWRFENHNACTKLLPECDLVAESNCGLQNSCAFASLNGFLRKSWSVVVPYVRCRPPPGTRPGACSCEQHPINRLYNCSTTWIFTVLQNKRRLRTSPSFPSASSSFLPTPGINGPINLPTTFNTSNATWRVS